jgi:hypothetical protein
MAECTCTKTIGEDMGKGQVPKGAAASLASTGLFAVTETTIQYLGGVGSRAKNEVGQWESPEICKGHTPEIEQPAPRTEQPPTEGDE